MYVYIIYYLSHTHIFTVWQKLVAEIIDKITFLATVRILNFCGINFHALVPRMDYFCGELRMFVAELSL